MAFKSGGAFSTWQHCSVVTQIPSKHFYTFNIKILPIKYLKVLLYLSPRPVCSYLGLVGNRGGADGSLSLYSSWLMAQTCASPASTLLKLVKTKMRRVARTAGTLASDLCFNQQ